MKYIYKHGNQYWYQRIIPKNLISLLGKKTIKISLKTNKVPIALKRAKLQSIEHKKLFQNLNKKKFKVKIFKNVDISKYSIKFIEDFDDLTSNILLNKKEIINILNEKKNDETKIKSLENIIFSDTNQINNISKLTDIYFNIKKIKNGTQNYSSIINSINYLIKICGNKSIEDFDLNDSRKFRDYFVNLNRVSTGKRYQSNLVNFFKIIIKYLNLDKNNPFTDIVWPFYEKNIVNKIFDDDELLKIKKYINDDYNNPIGILFGIMLDTGCSTSELVGININEINLNQFNPYLIIRSNDVRKIRNIYKKRTIPLVGNARKSIDNLLKFSQSDYPFDSFFNDIFKLRGLDNKLNSRLKLLSKKKTVQCFKYTLIERLKLVNCPEEVISEIVGVRKPNIYYQNDISIEMKLSWLNQIV